VIEWMQSRMAEFARSAVKNVENEFNDIQVFASIAEPEQIQRFFKSAAIQIAKCETTLYAERAFMILERGSESRDAD